MPLQVRENSLKMRFWHNIKNAAMNSTDALNTRGKTALHLLGLTQGGHSHVINN